MDYDPNKNCFLDLWIIRDNNSLYTDLYKKPTARNTLLRADSYHLLPLKNSLPYSQMVRLKIICSRQDDFNKNLTDIKKSFYYRGYKANQIQVAEQKM